MTLLNLISYVKRGKNRKLVFLNLNKPLMPSELVQKLFGSNSNTYFNLVSRALSELKKYELVEVLNPDEKTGRIYQRTKIGSKVYKKIQEEREH